MISHLLLLLAPTMMTHSVIRDSSHIDLVRIESASPSAWTPGSRQSRVRTVSLTVALERNLKGAPDSHPQLSFSIQQTEPGPRTFAVPGPWSGKPVDAGASYLVFSNSGLAQAMRVEDATTLPQVEFALEAERQHWSVGELAKKASRDVDGPLFGEYLLSRLDEVLYSDVGQFDTLLSWLESDQVPAAFRLQVVSQIFSKVSSDDPTPLAFWSRLTVSGFRIANLPDAGPLAESILSTYLPNLLGLNGGVSPKSRNQVFARFPHDQQKARALTRQYPLLARWLGN